MYFFKKIALLLVFVPGILFARKTELKLLSGGDDRARSHIEKMLTNVLNEINKSKETSHPISGIDLYFTESSLKQLSKLLDKTKFFAPEAEYRTYLLETKMGLFEVRNIKVKVNLGKTIASPFQNLVFQINKSGIIESIFFSLATHHYNAIIDEGKKVEDLLYREKILHFIEHYRTAYNKKDSVFIAKTLSDDALIIVGHVIKTNKSDDNYLKQHSFLNDDQIEFIRLGKNEYLKRLAGIFRMNDFLNVTFDKIEINRHNSFNDIYGVRLKQRWNSSTYSDKGYLFLMIDFREANKPIVHVRAWQPEPFSDGSTVSLYDFEIASY